MTHRSCLPLFRAAAVVGMMLVSATLVEKSLAIVNQPVVWDIDTIDFASSSQLRPYSVLALDGLGSPHVVFQRNRVPFQSEGDIFYATWNAGMWDVEQVAECDNCDILPDAQFDASGRLHIVFNDSGTLQYGVLDGGTWQVAQVPTPGLSVGHVSLALDSFHNPHVVFNHNSTASSGHYAAFDGGLWTVETIASSFSPYSIALDDMDVPIVAGYLHGNLTIAQPDSADWSLETVGPGGFEASLALTDNGIPRVGHTVINADDLRYAKLSGGGWTNEIVLNLGPGASGPSLALGQSGSPRLTYEVHLGTPGPSDDQVMHAFYNGTDWIATPVDPEHSTESGTSLAVSNDGFSHVVYSVQNGDLRYATAFFVPEPDAIILALIGLVGICSSQRHFRRICLCS